MYGAERARGRVELNEIGKGCGDQFVQDFVCKEGQILFSCNKKPLENCREEEMKFDLCLP